MINAASSSRLSGVQHGMGSGAPSQVSSPAGQPGIQKNQDAFSSQKAGKSESSDGHIMKMLE